MPPRVIALLLALVLSWSSFATQEQALSVALTEAESSESTRPSLPSQPSGHGSIDDHHLDDLPAQLQAEPLADLPAVLADHATARAPALAMARPWPATTPARATPCLAGLQRPPRTAAVTG